MEKEKKGRFSVEYVIQADLNNICAQFRFSARSSETLRNDAFDSTWSNVRSQDMNESTNTIDKHILLKL